MSSKTIEKQSLQNLLSQVQPTGYIVAGMENLVDIPCRKMLIDLMGSDYKRMSSIKLIYQLGKIYQKGEEDKIVSMVSALKRLSRIDAYRLFSVLPGELAPEVFWPNCSEERDHLDKATFFYATVGLWLIDSHRGNRHTASLTGLGLADAKKRALVSQRRYEVCEWLYMQHSADELFSDFLSVPGMWLLWEISICRRRLKGKYKHNSKRQKHDYWAKVWKQLSQVKNGSDQDLVPSQAIADSWIDFIENFEWMMLTDAKEMAEKNPDVDSTIYQPYLKAEKTWGSKALKASGAVTPYL